MKTVTENNKIIAEFMKWDILNDMTYSKATKGKWIELDKLKFHSNWNWLMEVVEKIETTSYKVPESFQRGFMKNTLNATGYINTDYDDRLEFLGWSSYCAIGTKTIWDSTMLGEDIKRYSSKIEAVYNACLEFIKWYNYNSAKNN